MSYTVADPYLFTIATWLADDGVDPAGFPSLQDRTRRMMERPAVRTALEEEA
jgi:glutathione S-transferase